MRALQISVSLLVVFFLQASFARPLFCENILGNVRERIFGVHTLSPENKIDSGLAEAQNMIEISEAIRQKNPDFGPKNFAVHIDELIPEAQKLVDLFEADVMSYPVWSRTKQMKQNILRFREELADRIKTRQVTAEWLYYFSGRIAALMNRKMFWAYADPSAKLAVQRISEKGWLTHADAIDIFGWQHSVSPAYEMFNNSHSEKIWSKTIPFPTTANLGLFAMNRLLAHGISPLGMIRGTVRADGVEYGSLNYWQHDNSHLLTTFISSPHVQSYMKRFLAAAELLPPEKRFKAELIFFYFVHEMGITKIKSAELNEDRLNIKEDLQIRHSSLVRRALDDRDFGVWFTQQKIFSGPQVDVSGWVYSAIDEFISLSKKVGIDVH